ncbi:FecR family protein [Chitinophaga japonensis]|uniref:FecR family protein n=1 Tax=Chitinophaga japonensis TaxID=104662 RepID=A0A562TDQ6_CHIJA|nr:FecR domain-containing protein [Chitinophaga japonensis]TWI91615.1 FecR family protein [Chitinophaga japonensis]
MMIDRALIEKFLQGQCTALEAATVAKYLEQHPEELEAILPEQEWEAFEPGARLRAADSEQMLDQVRLAAKRYRYRNWAAAAAVILLLGAGGAWWQLHRKVEQPAAAIASQRREAPARDTLVRHTGRNTRRIVLPDSSEVMLETGSTLRWRHGFTATQRALYLEGAATFRVTKEEGRPFIVYSGNVATTVLGTTFRICAYEGHKTVKVRLLSGKVMVKTTGAPAAGEMVYLTPGQECAFNKGQRSLTVYRYGQPESTPRAPLKGNIKDNGEELLFTSVPLPEVLDRFEAVYKVRITFSPQQLRKYYFTGQIRKSDAPEGILQTIATLNRLKVTHDSTGYHVFR